MAITSRNIGEAVGDHKQDRMSVNKGCHQEKNVVKRGKSETPANVSTRTATHFFQKISDARREKREAKVRQERATEEERIRREVDRRWRDHMATLPPVPIPRPSQQEPELPAEEVAPSSRQLDPSNPADSASIEYYRWCFHGEEKAEELPSWEIRHRLHCRGRRR